MSIMKVSLPDTLKTMVDEQVSHRGHDTGSECVRELIRKDQAQQLRGLLLVGAASAPTAPVDGSCFDALRACARNAGMAARA